MNVICLYIVTFTGAESVCHIKALVTCNVCVCILRQKSQMESMTTADRVHTLHLRYQERKSKD